jgi:hypothetical protein
MTDDSSARFPKLNDANYAQWFIMMEAELSQKRPVDEHCGSCGGKTWED